MGVNKLTEHFSRLQFSDFLEMSSKDYYSTEDTISNQVNEEIDSDKLLKYLIANVNDEFLQDSAAKLLIYNVSAGFSQSNPPLLLKYRNKRYLIRFCSESVDGDPSPIHGFFKQYQIISTLYNKTSIPVPKIYHYCSNQLVLGKVFYLMQFLVGRIFLNRAVHLPNLKNNTDRSQIYAAVSKLMARLHGIDIDKVGLRKYLKSATNNYWKSPKQWTIKEMLKQFNTCLHHKRNKQILAGFEDKLDEYIYFMNNYQFIAEKEENLTIIHGDIHFENIIFSATKNEIIALVDWETCTIGNPLFDITYFNHRWQWKYNMKEMSFPITSIPLNWSGFIHAKKPLNKYYGIPTEHQFIKHYVSNLDLHSVRKYNIITNINNHYNYYASLQIYRLLSIFYKLHQNKQKQFEKLLKKFPLVVIEYFTINGLYVLNRPRFEIYKAKL